jgi:hypothetical protein
MTDKMMERRLTSRIRVLLIIFEVGLIMSGLTAFPIQTELEFAHRWVHHNAMGCAFFEWIEFVYAGVSETSLKYPFIAYGTDWLAFAHLMLAIVFIGPIRDPVRNIWVIQFGLIACVAVFPLAMVAGEVRGIPMFWRLIDCSFGLFGGLILLSCHRKAAQLELAGT